MIFVTVGSMLPFDRLIADMDRWALASGTSEIFAQIGAGTYEPRRMPWARIMNRQDFMTRVKSASVIVAHAGIGSILVATEFGKPIVLLPRHAAAREHTTDHQIHTANWLRKRPGIFVAMTDAELDEKIAQAQACSISQPWVSPAAPEPFLDRIREFLGASASTSDNSSASC